MRRTGGGRGATLAVAGFGSSLISVGQVLPHVTFGSTLLTNGTGTQRLLRRSWDGRCVVDGLRQRGQRPDSPLSALRARQGPSETYFSASKSRAVEVDHLRAAVEED
ncbi:MAG: hypothetical protein ABI895_37320 [Deltaproteobacteria bacterium]